MTMAWLQLWTTGLMVTLVFSISCNISEDSVAKGEKQGSVKIVNKVFRKRREWIWNSLYVEEEKPAFPPYKIGQLKSSHKMEVMRFKIEGEGANTIFTVDDNGDLLVNRALDREEKSAYNLTAKLYDGNHKLIEDRGEFVVLVTDINDNIPVFPKSYNGSIMERSSIGTKVVEVRATDADDPTTANGELRYSLTNDGEGAFEINTLTGLISCKIHTLDRETKSQYVVVVKAQDMRGLTSGSTATTSVTITVTDINDNYASFTQDKYMLQVPENHKLKEKIGTLELTDRDQIQNKQPIITILNDNGNMFSVELTPVKDSNLILKQALDYETTKSYTFTIRVEEKLNVQFPDNKPANNKKKYFTQAQVTIEVLDVDEPPVFSQPNYTFTVIEEQTLNTIGRVTARDPDKANKKIRYSILQKDCPIGIDPQTGQLFYLKKLDREVESTHTCQVKAQEDPKGLESFAELIIKVKDINDNKPELQADDIFVCENDFRETVIGILKATDKDEQQATFSFTLESKSSNFSISDYGNGTAAIKVLRGPFSLDDPTDHSVDVNISDGGQSSITKLAIKLCRCDTKRLPTQCKTGAHRVGVSVHALIAILLCILTILVIVILLVMRKRYQQDSFANMKNSGEIHEQLVTYDEEGGGEMDTNGYDVSLLTSACHDSSLRHPDHHPHQSLYAMVQKSPHHAPSACKGDMAAMIEVKKDEADQDRDRFPFDTLHIYGYEGPESLAGSLSSLESSSTGSNMDYDFLSDWGPRFRTLAEIYGVDEADYYYQY